MIGIASKSNISAGDADVLKMSVVKSADVSLIPRAWVEGRLVEVTRNRGRPESLGPILTIQLFLKILSVSVSVILLDARTPPKQASSALGVTVRHNKNNRYK